MFYKRHLQARLLKEIETKQVVVLTGMRRVGKTTLMRQIFEQISSSNKAYLDMEDPLQRRIFETDSYESIWNNLREYGIDPSTKVYLFADEIQKAPQLPSVAKYLYDHYDVKFFFTGSSSYYLKNLFSESLAGRKLIFELYPLDFSEFLGFKGIDREELVGFADKARQKNEIRYLRYLSYYQEFIEYGGFPEVILEPNPKRKQEILTDIFRSYFELDVKSLADFSKLSKLRDLMLLLSSRVGSKIDITKIASELAVSRTTVYDYLTFLEKTYFIHLIGRFSNNMDRKVAGSNKVYLCDSGLAKILGQPGEGQLFESSVFSCLRTMTDVSYFSAGDDKEIDFITEKGEALEAKISFSARSASNLRKRMKPLDLYEGYVIALQPYVQDRSDVVMATDL
jgi:predicted AAA+ superfamily ATPase